MERNLNLDGGEIDQPKVAVLYGFGINCDHETKAVFDLVGADAQRVHVITVNGTRDLSEFQIMAVPGVFHSEITLVPVDYWVIECVLH